MGAAKKREQACTCFLGAFQKYSETSIEFSKSGDLDHPDKIFDSYEEIKFNYCQHAQDLIEPWDYNWMFKQKGYNHRALMQTVAWEEKVENWRRNRAAKRLQEQARR